MQSDLIREIAEQIVREQFLLNWKVYALVCGLGLVAGAAGYWLAPYLRKRAELYATKADMHEVLRQLEETTKVTEQVRATVSHADWVAREWRTVRRTKLEDLINAVYSLDHWLEGQQMKWIYKEIVELAESPLDRIKVITALYFPELKSEVGNVWLAHQNALMYVVDIGKRAGTAQTDPKAYQDLMSEYLNGWKPLYLEARTSISALERNASVLMQSIAGV